MSVHKPVLFHETIDNLNLKNGDVVVDATLGGGGHGREILKKIGPEGIYVGMDLDIKAIREFAQFPISNFQFPNNFQIPIFKNQNIVLANENFANLDKVLEAIGIEKVDAIMADLGWSSDQLKGKGMSFLCDEKLDMRLDVKQELTAETIVNEYPENDLAKIIKEFGEERYARNIARKIVENRKEKKIETTLELTEIVKSAVPQRYRYAKIHPATRTFQAIRIEVNGELKNLENFIPGAISALKPGGRLAIISFHSLEDRIVKKTFTENARGSISVDPLTGREKVEIEPVIRIINKKPIAPGEKEVAENPRSRSAKLRVCEKI